MFFLEPAPGDRVRSRNLFVVASLAWFAFVPRMSAAADLCPRPSIGAEIHDPETLRSTQGTLETDLSFRTSIGQYNLTRYCYIAARGSESPTLRVQPGDEVILRLGNELPADNQGTMQHHQHAGALSRACAASMMSASSTNLHFHGLDLPPICHQDETLRTLVQPADPAFEYRFRIPADEPSGLYWYHPHPHGFTEPQVLGGGSGALIVEGIERVRPEVAGLKERVLVLRDQKVPALGEAEEDAGPGKDISINFVPVMYPLYKPAQMIVRPSEREFWRVLNASADTYFDLQVRFGRIIQDVQEAQPLELVALDGVPLTAVSKRNHILLGPGARAEFIVAMPPRGMLGQLVTLRYDTGPDGAATPYRNIANLTNADATPIATASAPEADSGPRPSRDLSGPKPVRQRRLYFSEEQGDPKDPKSIKYFITVEGAAPKVFDMKFSRPDIVAEQGTVEDWVIENRAHEAHTFHIHQLHFQVLDRDGKPADEPGQRDTIDVPYWDGKSHRYPSVRLRMDFRNPAIVGTFVYHCHILEHEDGGMMGSIQVKPAVNGKGVSIQSTKR